MGVGLALVGDPMRRVIPGMPTPEEIIVSHRAQENLRALPPDPIETKTIDEIRDEERTP